MEQIECDICGGENKPGAKCDNFICPNYEPNRTMKTDTPTYAMLADMRDRALIAERELTAMTEQRDEWKAKYIQQNKDLGCEMMDPNGTIWDHAKKVQLELTAITEQRNRLAEALRVATAYPLSESWYKKAIEALATLKP